MKTPALPVRGKIVRGRQLLPASLTSLLPGCPLDESNPEHCPLHAIRGLPQAEALAWLGRLTTDEKLYLLQYHQCCLDLSVEQRRAAEPNARVTGTAGSRSRSPAERARPPEPPRCGARADQLFESSNRSPSSW